VSPETDRPDQTHGSGPTDLSETVLRAKYADFCSAQLTEVFLSLSDERIYEIVQEEVRDQALLTSELGFRAMVGLATKRLRASVPLPDFDSWREDYEAAPERYEQYLMGLWRQLTSEDVREAG